MYEMTSTIDQDYRKFEKLIRDRVQLVKYESAIFSTAAEEIDLFDVYLNALPQEYQQQYNCNCCRQFINTYGHLLSVNAMGERHSVLWNTANVPEFFFLAVVRLNDLILKSKITGVFYSEQKEWGRKETLDAKNAFNWTHLSGDNGQVFKHATLTAYQAMAEKKTDYATLSLGLSEVKIETLEQAVLILESDILDRSEKTLGVAKWLLALKQSVESRGMYRVGFIWYAVATAPPGWCHIRTTMISQLLDDLSKGMGFENVKERWDRKMHPLKYRRPTVISQGTIKQAENLVEKMGLAASLPRRFAHLTDVQKFLWKPPVITESKKEGVFSHLGTQTGRTLELPTVKMTWEKFQDTVLPHAEEIKFLTPVRMTSYYGLVTAVNPEAPPILQWDGEPRNPVSYYIYVHGSFADRWGLLTGKFVKVNAIFKNPPHWYGGHDHFKQSIMFVLDGAKDLHHEKGGSLFPESIRSELHSVRSVIEAYSNDAKISEMETSDANGILLQKDIEWNFVFQVKSKIGLSKYQLDRWN